MKVRSYFIYIEIQTQQLRREELANILEVSDRTVDVIIKRLRTKINKIPDHQSLLLNL